MTHFAILVPFKGARRKSRLSGQSRARVAAKLAWLMFEDLLSVLGSAGVLQDTFVITSDPRALALARKLGAGGFRETRNRGVNAAVVAGMSNLKDRDLFLVLPSDLPLLSRKDIRNMIALSDQGFIVVCPSASLNGTNALLFRRRETPVLSYDDDSFWRHISGVARLGSRVAVPTGRGVVFDVDSKADLVSLARARINSRSVAFAKKVVSEWGSR